MEAKRGKALNPLNGRFAAGRQVTDAATGVEFYAVQGSPEYFQSVIVAMQGSGGVARNVADQIADAALSGKAHYYLSSASWTRFGLPGSGQKIFQAADKVNLYQFQVAR